MNPDEMNNLMEQANIQGQVGQAAQSSAAAQYYVQEQEKNLAETQLEVESIATRFYHLLRQDVLKPTNENDDKLVWTSLEDTKQRALTDWGVDRIMQVVHFYINKNILLSNFDEKQIDRIMLRFCTELNDLVLLKYQVLFRQPTFEECKDILKSRLDEKKKLKSYVREILGETISREKEIEINNEIVGEIEGKIEFEIQKIREEQRKEKLREYGLLMAQMEAMVFATYNRAWKGEERGSIRRHTNISEVIGNHSNNSRQDSGGGMFKWIKR
jgi:hypothetical protein